MHTLELYWSYFRNTLGTLILLLPFFFAAWVFHLAVVRIPEHRDRRFRRNVTEDSGRT